MERTEAVLALIPRDGRGLTPAERARAGAFRSPGSRADFLAAHLLVRLCAGEACGRDPWDLVVVQRCEACGAPHGRPQLLEPPGWQVSLSHTQGVVAAAAAPLPVGVDVERRSSAPLDRALAATVLRSTEWLAIDASEDPGAAFLRTWVAKEALVKIDRCSLDTMRSVDLAALHGGDLAQLGDATVHVWEDGELDAVVAVASAAPVDRYRIVPDQPGGWSASGAEPHPPA